MPNSHISRFYEKSIDERRSIVKAFANLTEQEISLLEQSGTICQSVVDSISENVIGAFSLPIGIATHFVINNKPYLIPFATEEASVVAAASFAAKLSAGFTAHADEPIMTGVVQLVNVPNNENAIEAINAHEAELVRKANMCDPILVAHGGGARFIKTRVIESCRGPMLIVTIYVDVRDAMGASCVTTMCEALAPILEQLAGGSARICIVNNLAVERRAYAQALWSREILGSTTIDKIMDAYAYAVADTARACTHNKGIMNGIDAVLTATGNDVRAVHSGAHVWAARTGTYQPLTTFTVNDQGDLVGSIELPLAVGIVGGCTTAHPLARINLKILGVQSSQELAAVIASVGLAQNFAALRALVSEGIQYGHRQLHERKSSQVQALRLPCIHVSQADIGIVGYGAYVPQLRITVDEIARVWHKDGKHIEKQLGVRQKAVASRDEDAATIAIGAAQQAVDFCGIDRSKIDAVYVGSESHPYAVKPTASIVGDALQIGHGYTAADLQFACKAGTASLIAACGLVKAGIARYGLAIGADTAQACPGDMLEYTAASGGAAMILGSSPDEIIARIIATTSYTSDTPDFWRRANFSFPAHAGRFTQDPGYMHHVQSATEKILTLTGLPLSAIDHVVFHQPNQKLPRMVARRLAVADQAIVRGLLVEQIGNTYAGAVLLGLANVLDYAKPSEKILIVSYGSGAGSDAILFEVTEHIAFRRAAPRVADMLEHTTYIDYAQYALHRKLLKGAHE